MNQVILAGRVGQEPKMFSYNENKIAKFSVATTTYRNNQTHTEWHNITIWGAQAIFIEKNIHPGDFVIVSGFLSTNSYKDKNGQEKKIYSVTGTSVEKVFTKKATNEPERQQDFSANSDTDFLPY